jgi:hypothetical protein
MIYRSTWVADGCFLHQRAEKIVGSLLEAVYRLLDGIGRRQKCEGRQFSENCNLLRDQNRIFTLLDYVAYNKNIYVFHAVLYITLLQSVEIDNLSNLIAEE